MKEKILIIVGILLVIIAFVLDSYSIMRLFLLGVALLLIVIYFVIINPKNLFFAFLIPILLVLASYGLDCLLFDKFDRLPIFIFETRSSDKVSVYNSFFYRIFNCNNNLVLDYGYKKDFVCDPNDLDAMDINSFLGETLENFKKYKNKYVKLEGKISKISGIDTIELSAFSNTEDSLNGYVSFKTAYTVRLKVEGDLTKLRIYDKITVVGLVDNLEEVDEGYTVTLSDAIYIPNNIYESYEYEVVANEKKELTSFVEKLNIYLYGLDNIYVHYGSDAVYELSYLLTDGRLKRDDLIIGSTQEEYKKDEEGNLIGIVYKLDMFNIFVCENEKIILGNEKYKMDIQMCN